MLPWVREKLAESRLRWQNRKQQRNELNAPSPLALPSISTVSANDVRPHVSPTNARRLDSVDELSAPTTSAFLELQNNKQRSSSELIAADTNTNQLARRDFSIIHRKTHSRLNTDNHNHQSPGLVVYNV